MSQSIQPPNYLANMPNPQQSFVQGLQLGQGVLGIQQEQASQEQMRQALGQLAANPTVEGITRTMIQFPSLADKLKEPLKNVTETERTGRISSAMPIYAALAGGNPDVARERLLELSQAAENSGRTGEARRFQTLAETARINPDIAMLEIGGVLAANMGPDKFFETFKGVSTLPSTVQQGRATATTELPLRQAQVRTAQAGATTAEATAGVAPEAAAADVEKKMADIDKIRAEIADKQGDIPESARTIVNQSADAVLAARQRAERATSLAEKFTNSWQSGVFTRATDALGDAFGSQSEGRRFRQEFERLRSGEIVKSLPPGPATDRDIQLFSRGFPSAEADADTIKQFLQSVARVARYEETFSDVRGQWAAANGQLGPARREFTIDGIQIPRGTTFTNFSRQYLGLAANRAAAQEAEALARSRSYGRVLEGPGQ
jgi:hypothetical protein